METAKQTKQWVAAEIELTYKSKVKASERVKVQSSRDAYQLLLESWNDNNLDLLEQFKVIYTNRSQKVLGIMDVSIGGMAGTVVDAKIVFAGALKMAAHGIILAHNHPSGGLTPSKSDLELTRKLENAGKYLDISVQDHIIVTREGYYSFRDEGLMN